MPNGQHDHTHGGGAATAAYPQTSPPKDCGCGSPPPETVTCCDLVCFERPRYFCGHLLKDTDLSTEQKYVVEKHKLYHRALHGNGVVCGLRLTCDGHCCGNVRIDEGYAIDDCGNDIVVCDRQSFDVIARLKEKGLLIPTVFQDPCDETKETTPCAVRQCFYVVICYQETEHEFTTPLTPGCGPSPKSCEATRTRETYAFDVIETLPPSLNPLEELKARVEHCFELFADSPFAKALVEVQRILCPRDTSSTPGTPSESESPMDYEDVHKLYCRLRGLFLLYLKKHPDQYNCRLEQDVLAIAYPDETDAKNYETVEQAFCRLIELAYGHVLSCFFGELAFSCAEPKRASCVVLGTVEVEDGCVVRVCNCPRKYVWSFASFFQVLFATVYGSLSCETAEGPTGVTTYDAAGVPHEGHSHADQTCCRTFEIEDCCEFLTAAMKSGKSVGSIASAMIDGITSLKASLQSAFDPTKWTGIPAEAFMNQTAEQLKTRLLFEQVQMDMKPAPITDPLETFARSFRPNERTRYAVEFDKNGRVVAAQPIPELWARMADVERELAEIKARITPSEGKAGKKVTKPEGGQT